MLSSYLLGAVSFSYLVVRALRGFDVRTMGSGNAGATNVLRTAGTAPAVTVLLLDVGKGVAAVSAARWLEAPGPIVGVAAVAVVVGHIFPVYCGFRGGKGVATVAGAMGSLAPVPAALAGLVFLAIVAATRYVALGSIVGIGIFPLLIFLGGHLGWLEAAPRWLLVSSAVIALVIVFKHRDNVSRIRTGSEWKLGGGPRDSEVAG
ncbi:MAG: glycerol-3-phosphate 1-O-acyltransferase PlsY [bacterium]|nr:glycerol-3-phosphate 1-O-acyltransferase PlsY [bacterium]